MNAQGIRAGKAFVELFADGTKLQAGLKKAQAQLNAFASEVNRIGKGLVAASATLLAPLALATKQFIDAGDQLDKMSARTGLSVAELSKLKLAADYSGASIEDLETGIRKAGEALERAYQGDKQMAAAFSAIGVSLADIKNLAPDQQFDALAKAVAGVKNPTDQAYAAYLLFGKSGTQLLPLIQSLEDSKARAEEFGAVMSRLDATKAADLQDAFTDVKYSLIGLGNVVASTLQPALLSLAGIVANAIKDVRDWVDQNRGLAVGIAVAGVALGGLGAALLTMGAAASAASFALSGLSAIIGGISAIMGALVSPTVIAIGAIGALGYELVTRTDTGRQALSLLGDGFNQVKDDAVSAWGGISDALQSGNIMGAVKVVWAFIKLEFKRGTAFAIDVAQSFAAGVAKIFVHLGFGIAHAFEWSFNKVMDILQSVGAWLLNYFAGIVIQIGDYIRSIGLAAGSSGIKGLSGAGYATANLGGDLIAKGARFQGDVSQSVADRKKARDASLEDFDKLWDEKIAAINNWLAKGVQDRDAGIEQLRTELADAVGASAAARQAFDAKQQADAEKAAAGLGANPIGSIINQLANVKDTSTGTFSAFAARGIGLGSSASERTAIATEQTSKNTKIIADALRGQSSDTFAP